MSLFSPHLMRNPINETLPVRCRGRQISLGLILAFLAIGNSPAATFNWNAASGNWSTNGNWLGGTAPVSNTADNVVNLANGSSGTPAETTLSASYLVGTNGSLTINSYNALTLSAASVLQLQTATSVVTNHGILQSSSTGGKIRRANASAALANDGTIQALSGGTFVFWDIAAVTNTGGTIQAKSGGTVKFEGNAAITNGILKSESGGVILQDGTANPGQNLTLTGVAVNIEGTFTNDQTTVSPNSGNTTLQTNLGTGTVFTNAAGALTQVRNTGSGVMTNANVRASLFNVNAGSTFNNAGTLLIQNDATRTGTLTGQTVAFSVLATATAFTNTGTVQVIANTTAVGATAAFTSAQSITNQGVVYVKGNSNNQFASFSVTGAGNDYTQSGVGVRRTILEQGGTLSAADQVVITTGTLGGVGAVTGVTTIGSDAILSAGETYAGAAGAGVLAFSNNLILSNDSDVKFALGLNTAASSQVTLAGASGLTLGTNITLTLTDLTGGNWISGTTYRLFDLGSGSITGSLANFSLTLPAGWSAILSSGVGGTDYIDLTLAAVPEPSAITLLALGLTTVVLFRRRLGGSWNR